MYCWIKNHKGSIEAFIQGDERCGEYFTDGMCDLCKAEYQDGVCYTDHTPIKANYPVPAIRYYVEWDYCWCMGQRTRMHVTWWRRIVDAIVCVKSIQAD